VKAGNLLWKQGTPAVSLALVTRGELIVEVDGIEIGRISAGEMVGEVAVFLLDAVRSATVKSAAGTEVLTLSAMMIRQLRASSSPVYTALLDQALLTMSRRIRTTNKQIARLTSGSVPAPSRQEPGVLARLWRAVRPSPLPPCPELEPLLRHQPGLSSASAGVLAQLTKAFEPVGLEEGQVVFLEGDEGDACYLVGVGRVEVLRHVRGDRAELLTTLGPGDLFGANTLIEVGKRTASCVAETPAWVFRMPAATHRHLQGESRLVWREALLASLAMQVRNANRALQQALGISPLLISKQKPVEPPPAPNRTNEFDALLKASGFTEGLPNQKELETVRVVLDDAQLRQHAGRG
jgi:CRP-like cAMP-binding protein